MGIIQDIEQVYLKKEVPSFKVGDTVKVHSKISEGGKERIQIFEGIVIKRQGTRNRETFMVRKLVMGVGVERIYPVHSPKVEKIQVVKSGKVRRAKLFFLRDKIGSAATKLEEAARSVKQN